MPAIAEIWNELVDKLQQESNRLQSQNNPTYQDRKPAIGEIVFNRSPITNLVKGYNKYHYGNSSTHYNYSLQIGTATKVNRPDELSVIFSNIKEMFESKLAENQYIRINSNQNNHFLEMDGQCISVNIDFEGTAFNSISIRIS